MKKGKARWAACPCSSLCEANGEASGGQRKFLDLKLLSRLCVLSRFSSTDDGNADICIKNVVAFFSRASVVLTYYTELIFVSRYIQFFHFSINGIVHEGYQGVGRSTLSLSCANESFHPEAISVKRFCARSCW